VLDRCRTRNSALFAGGVVNSRRARVPAAATLDARVAELVAARRPVLEQLVAAAVDAELVRLVDVELERALDRLAATSTNGATATNQDAGAGDVDVRALRPRAARYGLPL